jgi:hypothetical protein
MQKRCRPMPYGASWHLHSETVGSLTRPCCTAIDDLLSFNDAMRQITGQ